MEGRTIVRPDVGRCCKTDLSLQWRAGQLSGQTRQAIKQSKRPILLQWRAGQLSGQTSFDPQPATASTLLQWRAGQLSGQTRILILNLGETNPSMEGRTIVRPDTVRPRLDLHRQHPSMEGRTIVRPDRRRTRTRSHPRNPSMEGRTIVRPDRPPATGSRSATASFNGGPDNCPARPCCGDDSRTPSNTLQWRAGQLSGQTRRVEQHVPDHLHAFNGGPDNCPARPLA